MTTTNHDVVRSFYESYNDKNLEKSWEQYISPKIANHAFGGAFDREQWLQIEKGYLAAFPDLEVEVLDQIAEGDRVATRISMTGTQQGDFYGVPAAGAVGVLRVTFFDRVEDGMIVEHWADGDVSGLLQQLTGAAPVL